MDGWMDARGREGRRDQVSEGGRGREGWRDGGIKRAGVDRRILGLMDGLMDGETERQRDQEGC